MQFDEVIKRRKSTRQFTSKKVSWKHALESIDAAINGPFAGSLNHLKFIIVEETATIKSLAEQSAQLWISEASMVIVVCSDDTNIETQYGERGRIYSRQQAGAAINTLILKLTDLGLSSCWVGSYDDGRIRDILKINKEHIQIEAIIPIGYEKEDPSTIRPKKLALENVLRWEDWNQKRRPTVFKEPEIKYR